jgi:tetratricopeptide (TPR) repeat protein
LACVAVAFAAPLVAGGVHRLSLIFLMAVMTAGLALFSLGLAADGRTLRFGAPALMSVLFLAVPIIQSIPIPHAARNAIDPQGTALLDEMLDGAHPWPLSLDPPLTRADIGKAALALAIFIVAYHLASGQTRRHLFPRAVGVAGIAAVVVGVGHRLLGVAKIYGILISTHRTLVVGPFVNANHTAELLELGAFACLACSFQRPTLLNRIGWLVGTLLCVGGAAATLSRGAMGALGVAVAMFVFLRYFAVDGGVTHRRAALAWGGLLLALIVVGAGALGAGQLVDRFQASAVTSDVRFRVWRDSLHVLAAHPFGIGRGAFDRVYPIYRTVKSPFALRFAFVENEPLQLLIDCGWAPFALLLAGFALIVWQIVRHGRRDKIEAALVAGLFAVLFHNLVDFGLETPGILLPFIGILATVLGRIGPGERKVPSGAGWLAVGLAAIGCIAGIGSISRHSSDDFDALLKKTHTVGEERAVLARARQVHPIDYFYALADAELQPLRSPPGQPSPRFHALNQALTLCPNCEGVHLSVGRNLWALGLRRQALLEYRSAVELQPSMFTGALGELFGLGAKPEELASIATFDSVRMIEVANYLAGTGRLDAAATVLDQAEALGAPHQKILVMRAVLQLQAHQLAAAQTTLAALRASGLHDAELAALEARATLEDASPEAADRALAILDAAAVRYPGDVGIQQLRIDLVNKYQKWTAVPRALEGYKEALYGRDGSATEAHLAAARIYVKLSHWTDALGEYRIALADQPTNVSLWMELGNAGESAGRDTTAREAYVEAARLSPSNPAIVGAIRRLDDKRREAAQPHRFDPDTFTR